MYSAAWVNQFETKDSCNEFLINNVSPQGKNVKTKLNLKVEEICRDCSPNFLWKSDNASGFCLVLSEAYL